MSLLLQKARKGRTRDGFTKRRGGKATLNQLLLKSKVSSTELFDVYSEIMEVAGELQGQASNVANWGDSAKSIELAQLAAKANNLAANIGVVLRRRIETQESQLGSSIPRRKNMSKRRLRTTQNFHPELNVRRWKFHRVHPFCSESPPTTAWVARPPPVPFPGPAPLFAIALLWPRPGERVSAPFSTWPAHGASSVHVRSDSMASNRVDTEAPACFQLMDQQESASIQVRVDTECRHQLWLIL